MGFAPIIYLGTIMHTFLITLNLFGLGMIEMSIKSKNKNNIKQHKIQTPTKTTLRTLGFAVVCASASLMVSSCNDSDSSNSSSSKSTQTLDTLTNCTLLVTASTTPAEGQATINQIYFGDTERLNYYASFTPVVGDSSSEPSTEEFGCSNSTYT